MKTLFKFILLTGLRDKLYLSILLILAGIFGVSNLVGYSALSEGAQMQVVYFAFLSRLVIVLGMVLNEISMLFNTVKTMFQLY